MEVPGAWLVPSVVNKATKNVVTGVKTQGPACRGGLAMAEGQSTPRPIIASCITEYWA